MNPEYYYIANEAAMGPYISADAAKRAADEDGAPHIYEVKIVRVIATSRTEVVRTVTWHKPYDTHMHELEDGE